MRKVIMNMKAAIMQETLSDVIQLKATSSVGVEMVRKKMEEMDKLRDELIRYVKENIAIKKALEEYIESYMCRKTRCLCDQLDRARRKDRFSVASISPEEGIRFKRSLLICL